MGEFLTTIRKFTNSISANFFVPGHKGGRFISDGIKRNPFSLDVTEFDTTDDLSNPKGIIKRAQNNAAEIFGAKDTYFLVNGSTVGIESLILAACNVGDKLIVDRSCHKSVINALILAGVQPIFVYHEFVEKFNLDGGIKPESVQSALEKNPDAVGAIITSPTYYGICSDIEAIAKIMHAKNKFLLVDEAHGAHFKFNGQLPLTALSCGADACVQSAHKTLPALTQSALLHINYTGRIDENRVRECLNLLQTTSPSYILLTTLDEAIYSMKYRLFPHFNNIICECEKLINQVEAGGKIYCVGKSLMGTHGVVNHDKTRLVFNFSRLAMSGEQAASLLRTRFKVGVEMFDKYNVVCVVTASNTVAELKMLEKALLNITRYENYCIQTPSISPLPEIELCLPPNLAFFAKGERVSLVEAEGKVCAETVSACPPGSFVCVPGQMVNADTVKYLRDIDITDSLRVIDDDTLFELQQKEREKSLEVMG